jgi:hypothetical protein
MILPILVTINPYIFPALNSFHARTLQPCFEKSPIL